MTENGDLRDEAQDQVEPVAPAPSIPTDVEGPSRREVEAMDDSMDDEMEDAIELVEPDEKFVYRMGKSTLWYRRMTAKEQALFEGRSTAGGRLNNRKFVEMSLRHCVLDWSGVRLGGRDVPFSPNLLMTLPPRVINELAELTGATGGERERRRGN